MTVGQFIPRADSWLGFFGKLLVAGGFIVTAVNFVLLDNQRVRARLAEATGVLEIKKTADDALRLANEQAATIASFRQEIVDVSTAISVAQTQIARTTTSLAEVSKNLDTTTAQLLELNARQVRSTVAPMEIVDPGRIEATRIGERTKVTIRFSQERDCGRADHWAIRFRDSAGLSGAFEDLSVNDTEGFGPRFDVAPGSFRDYSFTAVLPGDDLFTEGVAQGRVIVSGWQLCPDAEEARSPSIAFSILPAKKR